MFQLNFGLGRRKKTRKELIKENRFLRDRIKDLENENRRLNRERNRRNEEKNGFSLRFWN